MMIRWSTLLVLSLVVFSVSAQSGIRLIIWDMEPVYTSGRAGQHVGLGFDHDLNDRLSLGLDVRMDLSEPGWGVDYRSAFHFSDNEYGSFYMGPTIGVRQAGSTEKQMVAPLGFRMGVRGGLERFYADLHAGVKYYLGSGGKDILLERGSSAELRTATFQIGLDLAWGWAGRPRL